MQLKKPGAFVVAAAVVFIKKKDKTFHSIQNELLKTCFYYKALFHNQVIQLLNTFYSGTRLLREHYTDSFNIA